MSILFRFECRRKSGAAHNTCLLSTCSSTKNLTFFLTSIDAIKLWLHRGHYSGCFTHSTQSSDWEIKHPIKDDKIVIKRTRCKLCVLSYSRNTPIYFQIVPKIHQGIKISKSHLSEVGGIRVEFFSPSASNTTRLQANTTKQLGMSLKYSQTGMLLFQNASSLKVVSREIYSNAVFYWV